MKFEVEPFIFSTSNMRYCYDDSTKNIFMISEKESKFLKSVKKGDTFSDEEFYNLNLINLHDRIKKLSLFQIKYLYPKIDEEYITNKINTEGIFHLCLNLTESCNFRCNYCIYSDYYEFTKSYSDKKMDFDTAKRAVDYYFKINLNAVKSNPYLTFNIGFYGGEPIINWDIIVKVVEYIKLKHSSIFENINFLITTNGYLLDKDKIKFMAENHFLVSVSLDGDKKNHDRNRVTVDNKPTFNKVFENLLCLEDIYQKNLYSNFTYGILITYDNFTDFEELNKFFLENPQLDNRIQLVSQVLNMGTDYFKEQDYSRLKHNRQKFIDYMIQKYKKGFIGDKETNFSKYILRNMIRTPLLSVNYVSNNLKGACTPGLHKLTVDVYGQFHMCEKCNPSYSVGNIKYGLDVRKQLKLMKEFVSLMENKCKDCNIQNMCNLCYVSVTSTNDEFIISDSYCEEFRKSFEKTLNIYYSILEENPNIFSNIRL